ncbi:hypothetical protein [Anaerosphaera multitolerans]|uniref:hypothetical protein n=1 Tax=Anaerosphaera multitolerans TaxID=2487351 RepID=UPI00196A4FCB|nr:hypothetical protein [Anaerosphaera multitolerans]
MAVNLATKYLPYVDEQFTAESKLSLITNQDFDWTGAKTVKVFKVNTSPMNDYDRSGTVKPMTRYGDVSNLGNSTEEFTITKDRSFTYSIDKMDRDETLNTLAGASSLARQNREVVIPEIDTYVINKIIDGAGTKAAAMDLTDKNIYGEVLKANEVLDEAMVPEYDRYLLVTPKIYTLIKKNQDFLMATNIAQEIKIKGVVAEIDGINVIKIPSNRVPKNFGFLLCHKVATVAPKKLEEFKIHQDPPGISRGSIGI